MRKNFLTLFLFLLLPLTGFSGTPHLADPQLIIHNRVLATVNGKAITVIDVMHKMDLFLAENYPEIKESLPSRAQFYERSWRSTLQQIIDHELILADAEKMEMKVPDKEIRETIHKRFGPNVIATLDKLGMTYEEASQHLYSEMAVQRMLWYRIHSKALQKAGPQEIKHSFQEWVKHNPPSEKWRYQVLSIRSKTEQIGKVFAQKAYALIRNEPLPFEELAKTLKTDLDASVNITVSEEYNVETKDLSESHKTILTRLTPGSYSEPTAQVSRFDKSIVHRIFYLKEHTKGEPIKFDRKVEDLQDQILDQEVRKNYPAYLTKLRKQFNFDQSQLDNDHLPSTFQPFSLR